MSRRQSMDLNNSWSHCRTPPLPRRNPARLLYNIDSPLPLVPRRTSPIEPELLPKPLFSKSRPKPFSSKSTPTPQSRRFHHVPPVDLSPIVCPSVPSSASSNRSSVFSTMSLFTPLSSAPPSPSPSMRMRSMICSPPPDSPSIPPMRRDSLIIPDNVSISKRRPPPETPKKAKKEKEKEKETPIRPEFGRSKSLRRMKSPRQETLRTLSAKDSVPLAQTLYDRPQSLHVPNTFSKPKSRPEQVRTRSFF